MSEEGTNAFIITEEQIETIGTKIFEKAENVTQMYQVLPIPQELYKALREIMEIAKNLVIEITGENPWEGHP